MAGLSLHASVADRPLIRPFVISTGARTHQSVLSVRLSDGTHTGRGEATGVAYLGNTPDTLLAR
ncbi:MAG: hypothetical protein WBA35_03145, partial [Litorimonas sp.]